MSKCECPECARMIESLQWELSRKCFECPVKKQNLKLLGLDQNTNQAPGETGPEYVARLLKEARRDET